MGLGSGVGVGVRVVVRVRARVGARARARVGVIARPITFSESERNLKSCLHAAWPVFLATRSSRRSWLGLGVRVRARVRGSR